MSKTSSPYGKDPKVRELTKAALRAEFQTGALGLISCMSFEERSLSAAKILMGCDLRHWLALENTREEVSVVRLSIEAEALAQGAGVSFRRLQWSKASPLLLADSVMDVLEEVRRTDVRWIIDISTMTHEMALVLVAAIEELVPEARFTIVYNLAAEYSFDEPELEKKWVSRGIYGVRSVFGYSGLWTLGDPAVLVALPGFDLERVQRIIEEVEPEAVIVGVAKAPRPEYRWMYERNKTVANHILSSRRGDIFEYDSLVLGDAAQNVWRLIGGMSCNVMLAPLNTKFSTLALGALGRRNPKWQICYAPPLVYNLNYSMPSDCYLCCEYSEILTAVADLGAQLQTGTEVPAAL